jgi:hypothetical protein
MLDKNTIAEIQQEAIKSGAMDSSEALFDEQDNEFQEEIEKIELPYTLVLKYPIKLKKSEINEIVFKNILKAALHIPINAELKMGHFLPMISQMTGEPQPIIKQMAHVDFAAAVNVVSTFLLE